MAEVTRPYWPVARPLLLVGAIALSGSLMLDRWRAAAPAEDVPESVAPPRVTASASFPTSIRPRTDEQTCTGAGSAARGNPGAWVTNDDYPRAALLAEHQGRVSVAFEISAAGRVQQCRVTGSSGHAELDAATCSLIMQRGQYVPARDINGCTMRSSATLNFRWVIPDE